MNTHTCWGSNSHMFVCQEFALSIALNVLRRQQCYHKTNRTCSREVSVPHESGINCLCLSIRKAIDHSNIYTLQHSHSTKNHKRTQQPTCDAT